jgi:hypothetical protein
LRLIGGLLIFHHEPGLDPIMSDSLHDDRGSVFTMPRASAASVTSEQRPRAARTSPVTWAGLLIAVAALALTVWQGVVRTHEQAALVVTRTPEDIAVRVDTSGERAMLVAYWQIIIANNSTRDISLESSSVAVALPTPSGVLSRALVHGYRSDDRRMHLDFPHIITAGHVAQFLLRVRLPLSDPARDVIVALLASDPDAALWDAANLLALRGIDPFDSTDVTMGSLSLAAAAETSPPAAPPVEHIFSVRLRTRQGSVFEDFVTWSEISGLTARH